MFLFSQTAVRVSPKFLSDLDQRIAAFRPSDRSNRGIDLNQRIVFAMPDVSHWTRLTGFNVISLSNEVDPVLVVEIKVLIGVFFLIDDLVAEMGLY
jgi:hypothetical protein